MADLTEQQSALTVKVTGSDNTGIEDNYLIIDSSGRITVNQGAAGAANWLTNIAAFGGSAVTLGQATMANSIPVAIASNQSALTVKEQVLSSAGDSVVTVGTTNVEVVASNASRRGLVLCNCDGNRTIYLRFGSTAATSARHAVRLSPGATFEVPFPAFTGAIQGIASGAGGILLVQEFT